LFIVTLTGDFQSPLMLKMSLCEIKGNKR